MIETIQVTMLTQHQVLNSQLYLLTIGLEHKVAQDSTSNLMDMVYVLHIQKVTLTVIFQHTDLVEAVGQVMALIENGLSCHQVQVTVITSVFTIQIRVGYGIGMVLTQILD